MRRAGDRVTAVTAQAPRLSGTDCARAYAVMGAVTIAFSSILVRLSHAAPLDAAIFRSLYALAVLGLLVWRENRWHGSRTYVGFIVLLRQGGSDLRPPARPLFDATLVSVVVCIPARAGDRSAMPIRCRPGRAPAGWCCWR